MQRRGVSVHHAAAGRISRRRTLALVGGTAAAFLVACGGGGGDKGGDKAVPSAAPRVALDDTSAQAVRGGVLTSNAVNDPPNLDPYRTGSYLGSTFAAFIYNRLLRFKTGPNHDPGLFEPVPDLSEKYELIEGGMQVTFTLRTDAKMPNDPRVGGRPIDAQDVKFSWERFNNIPSPNKAQLAIIDKAEFPDDRTVVFKLKEPSADFLQTVADSSIFWVQPREIGEGKVDPSAQPVGGGPWLVKEYAKGIKWHFARNPNFFIKDRPFLDEFIVVTIPEYANRRAQFLARNIDFLVPTNEDAPKVRNEAAGAQFSQTTPGTSLHFYSFDMTGPFKDERVRRALSMATDRDGLIASVYGGDALKAAGLPFAPGWHNALPRGFSKWWLDPKSPEMGEAGKWYTYDVAEAKKLMEAAGVKDGFEADYHYTANAYGQSFNDQAEACVAMAQAIGIKPRVMVEDYASKYFPETFLKGNFKGYSNMLQTAFSTIGDYWKTMYLPGGTRNHSHIDDPLMAEMIKKQQVELDENKRKALVADLQKYASNKMYYVPIVNGALGGYTLAWQTVGNFRAFRTTAYGGGVETVIHYWRKQG